MAEIVGPDSFAHQFHVKVSSRSPAFREPRYRSSGSQFSQLHGYELTGLRVNKESLELHLVEDKHLP